MIYSLIANRIKKTPASSLLNRLLYKLERNIFIEIAIAIRTRYLSKKLYHDFKGKIKYGLFEGLKLDWWHGISSGKLLGIFEKEVLEEIEIIAKKTSKKYFIDIGASDGYYPIGLLFKGIFEHCYSFETSTEAIKITYKNALLNNVKEKLTIKGKLKSLLSYELPRGILDNSLILMDIAGGEFDLINDEFLEDIKNSFLIIELHDHYFQNGADKLLVMERKIRKYFYVKQIVTGSRDLSSFKELRIFPDSDRWLMCSDSRRVLGHWLVLEPK